MQFTYTNKSTPEDIRLKFNGSVDSFSDLNAGQKTAIDSTLIAELIAETASTFNPDATAVLDIGCGAGNYSLRIASFLPKANFTLVDLSENMLARAEQRLLSATTGKITCIHSDIRKAKIPENNYDIVVAATSLHHLREDAEWIKVFTSI
ncbi:MAG: class I SAM-dependent methyltransferase, partial [Bacteroidales bacterium]|nr:class I SAM-dependent methyltransferase [Bacteroidales bacterium]